MKTKECPNCHEEILESARACPECGACEETGWSDEAEVQGGFIEEEDFDYDDFVEREFGRRDERRTIKPRGISWGWWFTGVGLVMALAFYLFLSLAGFF